MKQVKWHKNDCLCLAVTLQFQRGAPIHNMQIVHVPPLFISMKRLEQLCFKSKASEKLWPAHEEEKKTKPETPHFITTALLVQHSQTAGFPAGELWLVLHQHFRDLISLKDLFAHSGSAVHLAVLTRLLNTIRLDKWNNIFPSWSVSILKTQKPFQAPWLAKALLTNRKGRLWLWT